MGGWTGKGKDTISWDGCIEANCFVGDGSKLTGVSQDLSNYFNKVLDDTDDISEGTNKFFFNHDNTNHTETYLTGITGESIFDLSDFPADPDADKFLKWNDTTNALEWADAGGGGSDTWADVMARGNQSDTAGIIDVTDTEALLVRKNADAGDVFAVDTTNSKVTILNTLELGHASDTTLSRSGAGVLAVEGKNVYMAGGTDVAVADGGTGRSTHTAYSLIAGGTTTTGAQQSIANSATTGAMLYGQGTSTLPAWSVGLIWDETNDRLGIGAAPSTPLTITLPAANTSGLYVNGDTNPNTTAQANPTTATFNRTKSGSGTIMGGAGFTGINNTITNNYAATGGMGSVNLQNYAINNNLNLTANHTTAGVIEDNISFFNYISNTETITGANFTSRTYGFYSLPMLSPTYNNGASSALIELYGMYFNPSLTPVLTAGTLTANVYGVYAVVNGGTAGTSTGYGVYAGASGSDTNWAIYCGGGNNFLGNDNIKNYFGTAKDASIYYDATNLVINPKDVGSGYLSILGDIDAGANTIRTTGDVKGVHKAADGTAAVADGTYTMGLGGTSNGTITIKDGIITAVQECVA